MYSFFIFAFLQLFHLTHGQANKTRQCVVEERGSGSLAECKFPFKFKESVYDGCKVGYKGTLWCSTQTDDNGNHVNGTGKWGYCKDPLCKLDKRASFEIRKIQLTSFIQQYLGGDDGSSLDDCPCESIATCEWSNKVINELKLLPRGKPFRSQVLNFVKRSICDFKTKWVRCCPLKRMEPEPEMTTTIYEKDEKDRGDWLPTQDCGVCVSCKNAFIIGGNETKPGELPFMALLAYPAPTDFVEEDTFLYLCGGTLINKYYVLTAAHCLFHPLGLPTEVVLGEHEVGKDDNEQRIDIDTFLTHVDYNNDDIKSGYDIALIRLKKPARIFADDAKTSVSPVCLPLPQSCIESKCSSPDSSIFVNGTMKVAGWGKTSNRNWRQNKNYRTFGTAVRVQQALNVPIQPPRYCTDWNVNQNPAFDEKIQICAGGEEGKDSCQGDSGGPLLYGSILNSEPWVQIGVVSFGPKLCGLEEVPATYTYVPAFIDWIRDNIKP